LAVGKRNVNMPTEFFVKIPPSVQKSMRKIPFPWIERIRMTIDSISIEPFQGEKMLGRYKHARKVRVWPYRIIYVVDKVNKVVSLIEVDHRGSMSYD